MRQGCLRIGIKASLPLRKKDGGVLVTKKSRRSIFVSSVETLEITFPFFFSSLFLLSLVSLLSLLSLSRAPLSARESKRPASSPELEQDSPTPRSQPAKEKETAKMADSSIPDASVAEFVSVTAASAGDAHQYLAATGGDVSAAVEAFYAGGGGGGEAGAFGFLSFFRLMGHRSNVLLCFPTPTSSSHLLRFSNDWHLPNSLTAPAAAAAAQPSSRPPPLSAAAAARAAAPSADAKGKAPAAGGGANNVRSLADVRKAQQQASRDARDAGGDSEDDEDSEDDGANEYYVGGDKSGQVVKGHPKDKKKKDGAAGVLSDPGALFDAARAAGAQDGKSEDLPGGGEEGGAPGGSGGVAFAGTGRTLAGGAAVLPADAAASSGAGAGGSAAAVAAAPPKLISHVIAVYDNGVFTVDDGPAREMADPANKDFLEAISAGRCPAELEPPLPAAPSAGEDEEGGEPVAPIPISVNLVRKHRDYVKPAYVAFGGQGRTLTGGSGGGGAEDRGKEPVAASPSAAASPSSTAAAAAVGGLTTWLGVDESQPTTSLQIRLRDGSRLVARFNLGHTVGDIKKFIAAAKPGEGGNNYSLSSMGFPPKKLEDDAATIEEAGLANAVVVQK